MAKKKNLGELDWDRSLDYEFEDPFDKAAQEKKRGVVTRVATSFIEGAKDELRTPAMLRIATSKLLPKGYGAAYQLGEELYNRGEELHNIAKKEWEPSEPVMRRLMQRHLKKTKRFLPKATYERLDDYSKVKSYGRLPTEEQMREQDLKRQEAEIFGVQMEASARQDAENRTERSFQHAQIMKESRHQTRAIDAMQQGIAQLVGYQDDITNRYQRRAIELKTRHYLVARDSLRLQVETARRVDAKLEALVTNTAMPDIAKQDIMHTATQSFRNRLLGTLQDSTGRFASNYLSGLTKRAGGNIRELLGNSESVLSTLDGDSDIPWQEVLSRMAGQKATQLGVGFAAKRLAPLLAKRFPGLAQGGGVLGRGANSLPLMLNRYAKSATKRDGFRGMAEDVFKDILGKHEMNTTVGGFGVGGLDKPEAWNKASQRTLIEIIPGLLSRIEHNTALRINPAAERQMYSHDKREFMSVSKASDAAARQIFSPSKRATVKQNINRFMDDLIGSHPMSAETRKAFMRQVLMDSGNGEPFDPERYVSPASDTSELDSRAKLELSEIFKKVGVLENGRRDQTWLADRSDEFNKIDFGAYLPTTATGLYRSIGSRDLLKDQDLIRTEKNKDKLNLSRIFDLIEGASFDDIDVKKTSAAEKLRTAAMGKVSRFTDDLTDLYTQGGTEAVLEVAKLKAGAYRDSVTGQVITKWSDIQGPIRDIGSNDIVVDMSKLTGGLYDARGKKYTFNLRTTISNGATWAAAQLSTVKTSFGPKAKAAMDILNARGEVVLSAVKLQSGHYRDAVTKKVIETVSDISGPVEDENGQTVVTASDIVSILTVKGGRRLEDALARMRARASSVKMSQAPVTDSPFTAPPSDGNAPSEYAGPSGTFVDNGELVRLNTEQVEILKMIAQILAAQGPNGGNGMFQRGFLDTLAIGGAKGVWGGLKGVAKGSWWWSKKVVGTAFGGVGLAGRGVGAIAQGGAHRVGNLVRGIKDIYVQGKRSPVMTAQRIKMGHYRDVNSNKRIVRYTDVTGPVIEINTGNTILDQEDFEKGLYVKGPAGLVRLAQKSVMNFGSAVVSFFGSAAALPYRIAGLALKGAGATIKWATNKQVDVYVKGESSPRLKATKMKLGRYYNVNPKKMGVTVRTYDDIYGEIKELQPGSHKAAADDKTVLYEEEITDPGLVGRWGVSLRTPLSKLIGAVGGAAISVVKGAGALFGGAMKGYGRLFGGMMGLGGGLIGAPFKFLGSLLNPFEKHGAKQVEWLERIHKLLDARLSGAKPRKGSWQEQKQQKEESQKAKKEETARDEKDKKWGIGGLLSLFKDKAKNWMNFGGDEEEEESDGDDGDTTIIAGGGMGGEGDEKKKPRKKVKGEKGGFRRNREARKLRRARAGRGKGGFLRRMMNPKALLTGALVAGGTGMAMDAFDADEDSTSGKVINGVGDVAETASNVAFFASMLKAIPWLGSLFGGGTAATAAATGAAGATAAAAGGTAATAAAGAGVLGAGAATAGAGAGTAAVAGTAAAAAGGTAAGVLGAPVWVPVAAVAATAGAGAYYGHKQVKYGKLTPSRRFRYLQYGIPPGDAGDNKKIFLLEELLLDHVGEVNGGLEVVAKSNSGEKDITMKEVYELMDMDDGWFTDNAGQRRIFNIWYAQRFKPVFLLWVKALRDINPKMSILEADEKLHGEQKIKLIKKAWTISRNLYAMSAGPFEGTPAVTEYSRIEEAYQLAIKDAGKSEGERSLDKWKGYSQSLMAWTTPGVGVLGNYVQNQVDESRAEKEGAELSAKSLETTAGLGMIGATGGIKHTKGVEDLLATPLSRLGKISALTAIRYRAYGLSELDLDRVRALAALESLVFKKVSIASSGNAYFPMDGEQAYLMSCGLFGLTANSPQDRLRWCSWFGRRFLPVCLEYIKAVRAASPTADFQTPERVLKASELLDIGQRLLNVKDYDGRSIWYNTASPWSAREQLNSDSKAISGSMLALKMTADKKVVTEEKLSGQDAAVKQNKGVIDAMLDRTRAAFQPASDWLLGDKKNRNWLGRQVDKAQQGVQAFADNASDSFDRASRGDYQGAAITALNASTAPARHMLGISPGPEPKIIGSAKDRESMLIQEAIKAGITDPRELAMLLGQMAAESGYFKHVSENLNYRPEQAHKMWPKRFPTVEYARQVLAQGKVAFADKIYNGRMGNSAPGDGYKYRGRGPMQLTGKDNYLAFQRASGIPVVDNPDLIATDPRIGALAAIHYWKTRVRGKAAPDDLRAVTKRINGGYNGLEHRRTSYLRYLAKFGNKSTAEILTSHAAGIKSANALATVSAKQQPPATTSIPATTTTTANGSGGGVGPVLKADVKPWIGTATAITAGSAGQNSLTTGGGYAGMMDKATAPVLATPAPSITSSSSLKAAAVSTMRDEEARAAVLEKERQQREQVTRAAEAQTQRQSQESQMHSAQIGEILQKSHVCLQDIKKNTADTVTLLRDILRQKGGMSKSSEDVASKENTDTGLGRRTARPSGQGPDRLPIDLRHPSIG